MSSQHLEDVKSACEMGYKAGFHETMEEQRNDKDQVDLIKGMVIHGLYSVTLKNGYGKEVFVAYKNEINRLFDNYKVNMAAIDESKEDINQGSFGYQQLDLSKIQFSGKVISTEEALKDVAPIPWSKEVLSGEKKVKISKGEIDYENKGMKVVIEEKNK